MPATACSVQNKTMPQKTIFTKYPLLSVPCGFLSCGLIRTEDQNIHRLYRQSQNYLDSPPVWEGVFRLAALTNDAPLAEPVTERIREAIADTEDGSFAGTIDEQIAVARAALALFEYNTDREIIRRIATWCRYLEIEWDIVFSKGRTMFSPADLMELLVCFYRVSGIKSVLRLCTRLRSKAFDWTTALHTIQQVIPLESYDEQKVSFVEQISVNDLDYEQKQVMLNHAVMLAEGMRYSLYAGLFSGNRQDLTAGKTAWNYLRKNHRCICGGTTSSPFLGGCASNAAVNTEAIAAWTEAFASEMLLSDSEWAGDELIRTVYNGLSFCLNADSLPQSQYVNCVSGTGSSADEAIVYARITRAVSAAFRNSVMVTEKGIRINYLLQARYMLMIRKQAILISSDGENVHFSCKNETVIPADIFCSATETAAIAIRRNDHSFELCTGRQEKTGSGRYYHTERFQVSTDSIHFIQKDSVHPEETHHHGVCWFVRNRLMVYKCNEDSFHVAVSDLPLVSGERVKVPAYPVEGWHLRHEQPDDIPVLPERFGEVKTIMLVPYDKAVFKVSMFPRINPLCLK